LSVAAQSERDQSAPPHFHQSTKPFLTFIEVQNLDSELTNPPQTKPLTATAAAADRTTAAAD